MTNDNKLFEVTYLCTTRSSCLSTYFNSKTNQWVSTNLYYRYRILKAGATSVSLNTQFLALPITTTTSIIKKPFNAHKFKQAYFWSKMQTCRVVACSAAGTCCTGKVRVDDFFTVRVQIHKHPEDELTSCNCVPLGTYKQRSSKQLQQTTDVIF